MMRIALIFVLFVFNDTATTEIYTLSLHDALPISRARLPSDNPWRAHDRLADVTRSAIASIQGRYFLVTEASGVVVGVSCTFMRCLRNHELNCARHRLKRMVESNRPRVSHDTRFPYVGDHVGHALEPFACQTQPCANRTTHAPENRPVHAFNVSATQVSNRCRLCIILLRLP